MRQNTDTSIDMSSHFRNYWKSQWKSQHNYFDNFRCNCFDRSLDNHNTPLDNPDTSQVLIHS